MTSNNTFLTIGVIGVGAFLMYKYTQKKASPVGSPQNKQPAPNDAPGGVSWDALGELFNKVYDTVSGKGYDPDLYYSNTANSDAMTAAEQALPENSPTQYAGAEYGV